MCTAATYTTDSFYFGRNLDYEFSYGDEVTITPRAYPFSLRCMGDFRTKYAMIGMAYVAGEYPLYYDAVNEKGLGIAGLNFVGNAVYHPAQDGKSNVAQFELIPWLLGSCATLAEVRTLLAKTNIVNIPFSEQLPLAQLHWLIADKTGSIVVESTADGLHIYDNPVGVLTNNPPFPQQLFALNNYRALSPRTPAVAFADGLDLPVYSRGLGALGLPGDLSSQSRFVRAAFVRMNAKSGSSEAESVGQFFHILHAVSSAAAVSWTAASTRSRSTQAAATLTRAFTTIRPTATTRSLPSICTGKTLTGTGWSAIRWCRANKLRCKTDFTPKT